tara:strand:- start:3904 stop:4389 length:486 start_codon:yes stop_codon:yes gene_type:complete
MFDATQYQSNSNGDSMDRTAIPEGNYSAKMTNFERKIMKSGNGEMLNVEFTVTVGSAARKCWHNFNLTHTNPKAVEIALQQLSNLCVSAGYNSIQDPWGPIELLEQEIAVYITVNDRGYNEIKAFRPKPDGPTVKPAIFPANATPPNQSPAAAAVDDEIPF